MEEKIVMKTLRKYGMDEQTTVTTLALERRNVPCEVWLLHVSHHALPMFTAECVPSGRKLVSLNLL